MVCQLVVDGPGDSRRQFGAGGDQDRRRQGIVFGLGHQIGSDMLRPGGVVSNDQDLAGARQGVDAHQAVHRFFGQGHPEVSRPADHIHPGYGFGTPGQGSDRLGSADLDDFVDAA